MSTALKNARGRPTMGDAARRLVAEFQAVTGRQVDAVTGVRRGKEDGWSVLVDVVESERTPAASVLAAYRVDADERGGLRSYERVRRSARVADRR